MACGHCACLDMLMVSVVRSWCRRYPLQILFVLWLTANSPILASRGERIRSGTSTVPPSPTWSCVATKAKNITTSSICFCWCDSDVCGYKETWLISIPQLTCSFVLCHFGRGIHITEIPTAISYDCCKPPLLIIEGSSLRHPANLVT